MIEFKKVSGTFPNMATMVRYQGFKKSVPKIIAVNSVNHFKKGFEKGGGQTNASKSGWAVRKSNRDNQGRNILVKTSTLQRDVQSLRVDFDAIVIGTSNITNKYAKPHNEGISPQTQREFIGDSDALNISNLKIIETNLDKIWQQK